MEINVAVQGQTLQPLPMRQIVAGSQNFVKFIFHLDEDWLAVTGSATNTFAQFVQKNTAYNVYLDEEFAVYLPPEITAGQCTVMLYGSNNTVIATSNCLVLSIEDNGLVLDASSIDITESLYEQMVDLVTRAVSGTPRVAHSASEMTDTEKVYIYLGSESEYTNGCWYYYSGNSWVSGGKYGGSNGVTFTPTVSNAGVISWTNDGEMANPESVDLAAAVIAALPSAVGVSF